MEAWLHIATKQTILVINAMALIVIVIGTIEAFVFGLRTMLFRSAAGREGRNVWMRYGHWLVAGLTFQLAADIVETSITPTWEDIGRLAAIALIRTFLNHFLDKDLAALRAQESESAAQPARAE